MIDDPFNKCILRITSECVKILEETKLVDSYTGELIDCEYNQALNDSIVIIKENFGVNDEI